MALCNVIEIIVNLGSARISTKESEGRYKLRMAAYFTDHQDPREKGPSVLPFMISKASPDDKVYKWSDGGRERRGRCEVRAGKVFVDQVAICYCEGGANKCEINEMICFNVELPYCGVQRRLDFCLDIDLCINVVIDVERGSFRISTRPRRSMRL